MVDVMANRAARKWTRRELALRFFWDAVGSIVFRITPRPLWGVRRSLLRLFGASIGKDVHVYPSVRISLPWNLRIGDQVAVGDRAILYALGVITVGARATISQNAHICAGSHDYRDVRMPLLKLPIVIGEDAWICADAFVGPGVTIGRRAIVGARAVITKNVDAGAVMAGNPARKIKERDAH